MLGLKDLRRFIFTGYTLAIHINEAQHQPDIKFSPEISRG